MTPMFETRLPSIDALRSAPVYFRYGSSKRRILIDGLTAQAVLCCYNAMAPHNKAKVERMVAGSPAQLTRVVDLCLKLVSIA